ncbi:MAG: hypothetical protein OEU92_19760 [Alphaproteobacteria bacterium]|nr:hypothetical protein [Alphaproteobacteria bacterium]
MSAPSFVLVLHPMGFPMTEGLVPGFNLDLNQRLFVFHLYFAECVLALFFLDQKGRDIDLVMISNRLFAAKTEPGTSLTSVATNSA